MADIFHEVDEEVRRERLQKLWDRYSIYIIALAVLIVAAIGGWRGYEYWEAKKAAAAGAAFESALSLSEAGKHAEAEAAFAKVATEAPAGYRMLARLRAAAELAQTKRADAVKAYDELAADTSLGATLQDLAAVRAGMLLVDSAPLSDMRRRLDPRRRAWPHLPPQRARAAGAVGLAQPRLHRRAPLYRHDRNRCRDAAGYPRARRCALGADRRRRRQELRNYSMRRMHRIVLLVGLVALAPVLAGCEDFDMDKFDVSPSQRKEEAAGRAQRCVPAGRAGRHARNSAGIHEGQSAAAGHRASTGGGARRARADQLRPPRSSRRQNPSRNRSANRSRARQPISPRKSPCSLRPRVKPAASSKWRPGRVPLRSSQRPGKARAPTPGRRRRRPAPSRADASVRLRERRPLCAGRIAAHELHHRHCRPAQCRQVDAVQPAGRPARRAGRRPAGRDARPPRRRGPARRSRFHRDRYRGT